MRGHVGWKPADQVCPQLLGAGRAFSGGKHNAYAGSRSPGWSAIEVNKLRRTDPHLKTSRRLNVSRPPFNARRQLTGQRCFHQQVWVAAFTSSVGIQKILIRGDPVCSSR